jgi:hypothetical protein
MTAGPTQGQPRSSDLGLIHWGCSTVRVTWAAHTFPHDVVRVVGSVQVSLTTIMDPDAYVIDGTFPRHPDRPIPIGAVKLVVEVSVTTQLHDGGPKLHAYAQAAVPEVWLIDPRPDATTLTRHRHPRGNSYLTNDTIAIGETPAASTPPRFCSARTWRPWSRLSAI